ncbi:MAG: hypothetical protein M0026_02270 [Nocardiopsaceae bacterium]|nr:hypothetical protein [Nocardiopsaceae bacterium]
MDEFKERGNDVLGYVAGLGVLLGVLALIIIGGRMIHANFTGDPWIAARGMAELPWVVLGVALLVAAGSLAGTLLQGSVHATEEELGTIIKDTVDKQNASEREHIDDTRGPACLVRPSDKPGENGDPYVCPDDDDWEELAAIIPLEGPEDRRCTETEDGKKDCYEYCYITPGSPIQHSPCTTENLRENSWVWADYHCPNLIEMVDELTGCPDAPSEDSISDEVKGAHMPNYLQMAYVCEHFPDWVTSTQEEPETYCEDF